MEGITPIRLTAATPSRIIPSIPSTRLDGDLAMIQFLCPHCSYKVTAGDSFAGKVGKCPLCDKDLLIPNQPRREPPPPLPQEDMSLAEPVDALPADDYPPQAHPPNTDDRYTDRPGAPRPAPDEPFADRSRPGDHPDDDEYD